MINVIDLPGFFKNRPEGNYHTRISSLHDGIVSISLISIPVPWHWHPNSDETLIVLQGILIVQTHQQIIELGEHQMLTIPQNVRHRTAPGCDRVIHLTIGKENIETLFK